MSIEEALFVILGFASSLISAVFGFGTALFVLAIGSYILPMRETVALATVLFTASTLSKSILFRKQINWKIVAGMSITSLPFAWLGAAMVSQVPAHILRMLLGWMIVLYLSINLTGLMPKWRLGIPGIAVGSAVYGFLSGLLGSGNVVKVVLFREIRFSKEAFVGAMAATSVLANLVKGSVYYDSGLLHIGQKWAITGLIFAAVIAAFIGRFLLNKITTDQFNLGLNLVLGISAIGLILQIK
ncbi:MAG: sulfite exporter TauE/SafE family protein [Acidiferrobacterales bacterium]|nr:sulfite exporter TauE/SafE family protein [Acidiferrobacterales bacterium]